jgi:predicted nuclease of predicted toxin-antitoxin system
VRLLFDQNLSRRLLGMLRDAYPDSVHVVDVELDAATDRDIWEYAGEHDLIVVSKDSDFRQLAFLHGPPPKVVWLRVGNTSTAQIATVLLHYVERIETFVDDDEEAMLVIPAPTER